MEKLGCAMVVFSGSSAAGLWSGIPDTGAMAEDFSPGRRIACV
jgi:hypothetical protein